ncbi:MAG: leucine-rich repeat domain-containing protein [Candidatus Bipolaricaulota bacterium]
MFKGDSERNRIRILHVLVVTALVFIGISSTQTILAESKEVTDPKYFEFDSNTRTLTEYDTAGGSDVVIPPQIDEVFVEKIGQKLFYDAELTAIEIPDSVEEIGEEAFASNKLTTVEIPDRVQVIGDMAFHNNNLDSIDIGDRVKEIGEEAFASNKLSSVVIPDSVRVIGPGAFKDNKLTSIEIPDNVKEIGKEAFEINDLSSLKLGNSVSTADSSTERNFQEVPGEQNQVAGRYGSSNGEEGTTEKGAAEKETAKIDDDITGTWRVVSGDTNCKQMVIEEEIWIAWENVYLLDGFLELRTEMGNGTKTEEFESGSSRTKLDKNVGRLRIFWADNGVTYRLEGTFNFNQTVIEGTVYKAKGVSGVWELEKS